MCSVSSGQQCGERSPLLPHLAIFCFQVPCYGRREVFRCSGVVHIWAMVCVFNQAEITVLLDGDFEMQQSNVV